MRSLLWTRKTVAKITAELNKDGIMVGETTVASILKDLDYSLKTNVKSISNGGKTKSKSEQIKRDSQFEYINNKRLEFEKAGNPILSCDTKKKEMIGNFKNEGTRLKFLADLVNDHDFLSYALGKANPYGIYDVLNNLGFVVIGKSLRIKSELLSADTPEFAVESLEQWWITIGQKAYKKKKQLLLLVDAGGSNGYRSTMWKINLQKILADRYGLTITVCHYPPGASKWNPIEHMLFSQISNNWKGTPLIDYETIEKYIQTTTTKTGLSVDSVTIGKIYEKGIKGTPYEMNALNIQFSSINKLWGYTISPTPGTNPIALNQYYKFNLAS